MCALVPSGCGRPAGAQQRAAFGCREKRTTVCCLNSVDSSCMCACMWKPSCTCPSAMDACSLIASRSACRSGSM
eukprot:9642484-Prorocentrum_lima.AAC.1